MLKKRIKFGIVTLIFSLSLTSVGGIVSAKSVENVDNDFIPEGFIVTKAYDETDLDYNVSEQKAARFFDNSNEKAFLLSTDGETESSLETEILKNETHKIRDIKNLETGEERTQYKTDVSLRAFKGDNKWDPSGGVNLSITIYSSTYYNDMYTGMDKAYVRWDKEDSTISSMTADSTIIQVGPGKNGAVTNQNYTNEGNHPGNPWNIISGNTYLFEVQNYNWEPVLTSGLGTQIGVKFTTQLKRGSTTWKYTFGVMVLGTFPQWPE
ncbi:hypothetical protein NSQ91_09155 [Paenibacillus sp. FSL R7-0048]|uniref:hypothetical protein n=1 Tax=Paenibacillus TaxID=44249 RepID=UPI00096F2965|nr:hypothetical protein [Paenibacillus odorifer]OMD73384.1 hypothetical protein BSK48_05840 [Paenibacillus odorifer]